MMSVTSTECSGRVRPLEHHFRATLGAQFKPVLGLDPRVTRAYWSANQPGPGRHVAPFASITASQK